jgi:VirE N-terminal domain/AAA domain
MSGRNGHPDFTLSVIGAAHLTETRDSSFRAVMDEIAGPRWKGAVDEVRAAYAHGGKAEADAPKKKLPGILFSGTFSQRKASALVHHSGLICVDLDGLNDRVEALRETIVADPHTLGCFVSPTGTGLKVIFRCDPARKHEESFKAAERFVLEQFGLPIDPACKDVCRICFVSHDPEAFAADDAEVLPYPADLVAPPKEFKPLGQPAAGDTPGDDFDRRGDVPTLLAAHGWTKAHGAYWTRPGKTSGVSASWNVIPGRFWVFSSSVAGLEPQHTYKPWHLFAILECGGDFAEAARRLGAQGFGTPSKSRQQQNLDRLAGPPPDDGAPVGQGADEEAGSTVLPPEPLMVLPAKIAARSLFDFQLVKDGDVSIILGDRYLNRGDGAVISSTSGMGKSAICIQGATELALNLGPFGIQGNGPLKSLIIQSEDSDGDVAEVAYSMKHVLHLTPEQIEQVNQRVKVVTDRVNRGTRFIAALKKLIEEFKPDIVWINPLQAYIDGDVTDSKDLGSFLREGLNSLNQPPAFAYIIIHHTTKPATGKDRAERQWHEVMYDMAGGAEIINWARAIISLRATPDEGCFNLVLAKRGRRAGVTKKVPNGIGFILEPTTTIPLKHATGRIEIEGIKRGIPLIYWEPRVEDVKPEDVGKGGRPVQFRFEDFVSIFPKFGEQGKTRTDLWKLAKDLKGIKETAFRDLLLESTQKKQLHRTAHSGGFLYTLSSEL